MKKSFSIPCMVMLCSCAQHALVSIANPPQKTSMSRTETVEVSADSTGSWNLMKPKVKRQMDNRRLAALRANKQLIQSYFAAVDKSIMGLLKQSAIPKMIHRNWSKDLDADPKRYATPAYSAALWRATIPKGHWLSLSCNAGYDHGSILTPAMPNPIIRKPKRDLRFDWYIKTGNRNLDKKIKDIVIKEAKKF